MTHKENLIQLFEKWAHESVTKISPLPASGSSRIYFRIESANKISIGAFNPDLRENKAFVYLTKHFLKYKLDVPKILSADLKNGIYLLEDIDNQTLFSFLNEKRTGGNFPHEVIRYYKRAIEELPKFQIAASKGLDYSKCYPRKKFDRQSIQWDLNYFKYYFLKLAKIYFDEEKLENDFKTLTDFLLKADSNYFMYRDFNSRNIMIKDDQLYFIDFQGGRKGALQYDIASLLLDSKANIPFELREEFLEHYISSAKKIKKLDTKNFKKYFTPFALIRLLQTFGAYGYRGYFEGKAHFLQSIPFALKNLEWILEKKNGLDKIKIPELRNALEQMLLSNELKKFRWEKPSNEKLTVTVNSFSYRNSLPVDLSGNGGGFVFDCRTIQNPGLLDEYRHLTGKDKPVQNFLDALPEAQNFLKETFNIVGQSVKKYMNNKWANLMVSYGCTGGQHRSVYCAERLAAHLQKEFDVNVKLIHTKI